MTSNTGSLSKVFWRLYLRHPRRQFRFFLKSYRGEISRVAEGEEERTGYIYFRKKDQQEFESLVKLIMIEMRKRRVTGACPVLAEALLVALITLRYGRADISVDVFDTVSTWSEIFIGIPSLPFILQPGAVEALRGIRFGRFETSLFISQRGNSLFGTEEYKDRREQPDYLIKRDPLKITLPKALLATELDDEIREHYFAHLISVYLALEVTEEFRKDQRIAAALNKRTFYVDKLLNTPYLHFGVSFGSNFVTSISLLTLGGEFLPEGIEELDSVSRQVEANSKVPIGSCKGVDAVLNVFAEFVQNGHSHHQDHRRAEAFIHFVIALEILLGAGSDKQLTKSISSRGGIIWACDQGIPFAAGKDFILSLYDARSKYVHTGKDIDYSMIENGAEVCRAHTEVLLRLRNQQHACEKNYITSKWLKEIDFLVSAQIAGLTLPDEFYVRCGLAPFRAPEGRVVH